MSDTIEKFKKLLVPSFPSKQRTPGGEPELFSCTLNTAEGPSKIHIRSFHDGTSVMVVDGTFMVSLNSTTCTILKMKLEGRTDESVRAAAAAVFPGAPPEALQEDISMVSGLVGRLKKTGPRAMAGEHSGNLLWSFLNILHPFRADIQLLDPESGETIDKNDGLSILKKLYGWGVISIRFFSAYRIGTTPVTDLVERTQDMGIIAGLMIKGRELIDKKLLSGILDAGIDYFEVPLFSDVKAQHEKIEGTNSFEADLEGIKMITSAPVESALIADIPITSVNIDGIEGMFHLLERYGITNVNIGAVIVPNEMRNGEGLGITLQEYEHAVVAVEEAAQTAGVNYVFSSPIWYRKKNPRDVGRWGWKCTASENAPFITTRGDIFPCLHSDKRMGNIKDAIKPQDIPLPLQVLTKRPPEEVDHVTLCNGCCG